MTTRTAKITVVFEVITDVDGQPLVTGDKIHEWLCKAAYETPGLEFSLPDGVVPHAILDIEVKSIVDTGVAAD